MIPDRKYQEKAIRLPVEVRQKFMDAMKEGKNIGEAKEIAGIKSTMVASAVFSSQVRCIKHIKWEVDDEGFDLGVRGQVGIHEGKDNINQCHNKGKKMNVYAVRKMRQERVRVIEKGWDLDIESTYPSYYVVIGFPDGSSTKVKVSKEAYRRMMVE